MSYALFNEGKIPVADPTVLEERVSDATLVLAVNSYRELCSMHLAGVVLTSPSLILKCSELAAERSRRIVEFIKSTLESDTAERAKGNLPAGFAESIRVTKVQSNYRDEEKIDQTDDQQESSTMEESDTSSSEEEQRIKKLDSKTIASNKWSDENVISSEESGSDEEMPETTKSVIKQFSVPPEKQEEICADEDSSEEDEKIVLK